MHHLALSAALQPRVSTLKKFPPKNSSHRVHFELTMLTFLGIDPGFDRMGWAIGKWTGKTWQSLDFGCLKTNSEQSIFDRYQQILADLEALIVEFQPEVAGIESVFFSKNQKTALRVSEARGLIIAKLLQHDLELREFTPNQIKQAVTGNGHADKTAVAKMVRLGLQLGDQPIIDDAMDALATLLTCQTTHAFLSHRSTPTPA